MIRSRPLGMITLIFAGYILLQIIANEFWMGQSALLLAIQLPAPAISCYCQFQAGLRSRGNRSVFWMLLSAGSFLYFTGMCIWGAFSWFGHIEPPIPSVADFMWNGQTIMYLIALCYMVGSDKSLLRSLQYGFDTLLVFLLLGLLSWEFIILPNYSSIVGAGSSWGVFTAIVYPISDFAITCNLLLLFTTNRSIFPMKVQLILAAAFLVFVLGDTGYFFMVSTGTYEVGRWVDPVYSAGLLLFALSGLHARRLAGVEETEEPITLEPTFSWWLRLIFPILCIIFLSVLVAHHIESIDVAVMGSMAALLLIIVRQVMVTLENRRLMIHKAKLWKETEFLANHDSLSKLPNRRCFEQQLKEEIMRTANRKDRMLAVLFLDLDRFKVVNDSLGHAVGDSLIVAVAKRLATLADERHLVARLGGDEYTVLIKNLQSYGELTAFMEKLHETIGHTLRLGPHNISVTTSIGASICPIHGMTVTDLMKNADAAMYKAKSAGTGTGYIFTSALEKENALRAAMEQKLHEAVEENQFSLVYQPQVRAIDGKMLGVEALIRWNSASGPVSPGVFIPLAEETGLIIPIGEWVLRTSCRQAKEWLDGDVDPFCLSVNVSPKQFEQENFVELVRAILKETGFPPHLLILEITESIAIQDGEETIHRLVELKRLGVQISMDDFGTGYSSLHYLQRFRVDGLKIAQSFISGISDERDQAVVRAILAMASSLQLTVVAEGVETEEQYRFLKEEGCDVIQGYYFYKPMPASELRNVFGRPIKKTGT